MLCGHPRFSPRHGCMRTYPKPPAQTNPTGTLNHPGRYPQSFVPSDETFSPSSQIWNCSVQTFDPSIRTCISSIQTTNPQSQIFRPSIQTSISSSQICRP